MVGRSWDVRLDPELTEDAGRYRKYDFSSVRDLLRVVRNKRHHFHELPERVQKFMSPLPAGFLRYDATDAWGWVPCMASGRLLFLLLLPPTTVLP